MFTHFYSAAILLFIIIGCLGSGSSYTDIISAVYIFLGIFYLIYNKKIEKEKNKIWN